MDNRDTKKSACLTYILAVVATAAYGLLLWRRPLSLWTYFLGLIPAAVVSNLIHELCHLGAYVLLGIPWKRLRFAFLLFEKKEEGLSLSVDFVRGIGEAECTCLYRKSIPCNRYAFALLSGGGGCLLLGGAVIVILLFLGGSPWVRGGLQCLATALVLNGLVHLLWPGSTDRKLLRTVFEERKGENL